MTKRVRAQSPAIDERRIYCPAMGTVVEFAYCRVAGVPSPAPDAPAGRVLPCARILGCWHSRIDVVGFLVSNYTDQEIRALLAPRPSRMDRLYEAAAKAGGAQETDVDGS